MTTTAVLPIRVLEGEDASGTDIVEQVTDTDVIVGKSTTMSKKHAGNIQYSRDIKENKPRYRSAPRKGKKKAVVVRKVQEAMYKRGGRFVKQVIVNPFTGRIASYQKREGIPIGWLLVWLCIPPKAIRSKISADLRGHEKRAAGGNH